MPIPAPYNDPPQYDAQLFGVFVDAFNELSAERRPYEKIGKELTVFRINQRDIREWCERNGYGDDPEFQDELAAYVPALDLVWVELEVKRLKSRLSNGKP